MDIHRCILLLMLFVLTPVWSQEQDPTTPSGQSSPFSQAKFVPDISLILDGSYLLRSQPDERYNELNIPGVAAAHDHEASQRGFNLNYAEISFFSIVDPYFELFAVCHVSEHHFHLEEAYWLTKKFPAGFQLKAGKFLSGFGRINEQHAHYWDFDGRPLIHEAVFGAEGLNEVGARLTWVTPTEMYLMVGGEVLMGDNEASFGRTGIHGSQGPVNERSVNGPGLFLGYCRTSVDIGDASLLLGLSVGHGATRADEGFSTGLSDGEALAGNTLVGGGDLTIKYLIDAIRYVAVQSEFLYRFTDALHYTGNTPAMFRSSSFERRQSGIYLQAVAKVGLRWRAGIRFDLLQQNELVEDGRRTDLPENLPRLSGMAEFSPTEFSRIRVQYNYDRSQYALADHRLTRKTVHELTLHVNLAIGAHGAHTF